MSFALELAGRQLLFVLVLSVLGSGLVALLPRDLPPAVRVALAPALGLALASAILVTASYVMPMSTGAWLVLVPLAVLSSGFAVLRGRGWRPDRRNGTELALIALTAAAVLAALDAPLVERQSSGPMGYLIPDAGYLVAQHDALERHPLRELGGRNPRGSLAIALRTRPRSRAAALLSVPERREFSELIDDWYEVAPAGASAFTAAVNALARWSAADSQTAFLAVLVLISALGAAGLVRHLTGRIAPAVFAGLFVAGPVAFQLFVESGEGALSAMTMIAPAALVGTLIARDGPRHSLVFLLGVVLAGLSTLYGLWLPAVVLAGVLGVGVAAAAAAAKRRPYGDLLKRGGLALAGAGLVCILLSPVAFARNVEYWHILAGTDMLRLNLELGFPEYLLSIELIPGWLLQTRELYSLVPLDAGGIRGVARGFLLPLAYLALIALGAWRFRGSGALLLLAPLPVVAVLAYNASSSEGCSYCVQRQLVLLEPLAAALLACGLTAVALAVPRGAEPGTRMRRALGVAAVGGGLLVIGVAAQKGWVLAQRALDGGGILDPGIRDVLSDHDGDTPVAIEAAGATLGYGLELPATYYAVYGATGERPSLNPLAEDAGAIVEFTPERFAEVGPHPGYRQVLTRVAGIDNGRETLARSGPFALQRRARPFDVIVVDGVAADLASRDPAGRAWVQGALVLDVAAERTAPATLRLGFRGPAAAGLIAEPPARVTTRSPTAAEVCAPVPGRSALRHARVELRFERPPPLPPPERYGTVLRPGEGLSLERIRVSARRCPPAAR